MSELEEAMRSDDPEERRRGRRVFEDASEERVVRGTMSGHIGRLRGVCAGTAASDFA